jgi:hypothetical protein
MSAARGRTAVAAWRDGMGRVATAPAVLAGVWIMTAAATLPLTIALRAQIEQHLGSSLAADTQASGVNYDWMQEFAISATGVGATFGATVIGFAAVLDNLSSFIDQSARPVVIVAAAAAYIVVWLFVAGGVIDRYARNRPTRAYGFFSASGVFFLRFARLAVVMFVVYGFLFRYVHPWLFDRAYGRLVRNLTVERTAFFLRLTLYIVFAAMLAACNLVFDYAKVRAVVEDRRSMLGAIGAALRFIRRHGGAAAALYLLDVLLFAATIGVYAAVAPGVGGAGATMWIAFAIGQLYVLARLWVKLVFWASETALFQNRLAHAAYIAAPEAVWPEAPMVEAIRN